MSIFPGEQPLPRLIYKGAEAEIYLEVWHGELAIRKSRIAKPYRIDQLDDAIRRSRSSHEASMMHEVRKLGVPVPALLHIDPETWTLIMEYIQGPTLKEELYYLPIRAKRARCKGLGRNLGLMHEGGAVHGDLTISNVLSQGGKLFMIDFGLSELSNEIEDRGVDLVLLNRVFKSTHYDFHVVLFKAFLNGYTEVVGKKGSLEAVKKMREIERRGRYVERT
jgi:TP53 regulating kinase-like protein